MCCCLPVVGDPLSPYTAGNTTAYTSSAHHVFNVNIMVCLCAVAFTLLLYCCFPYLVCRPLDQDTVESMYGSSNARRSLQRRQQQQHKTGLVLMLLHLSNKPIPAAAAAAAALPARQHLLETPPTQRTV
jgi:hypothetical protein